MLQSMGLQRVGHNLVTEQQQRQQGIRVAHMPNVLYQNLLKLLTRTPLYVWPDLTYRPTHPLGFS